MKLVMVASGKGGTGKSTTVVMLGRALSRWFRVGLLDLDITGPNLARMAGATDHEDCFDEYHFYPVTVDGIQVFSPSFLIPEEVAVAWSGDQRKEIIHELLLNVKWDSLDLLLCDSPPGTGDEILAVLEYVPTIDGALVVTNSTREALDDAHRLVSLLTSKRFIGKVRVLGVVLNMETMLLPDGSEVKLHSDGINAEEDLNLPVIARIPFKEPLLVEDFLGAAEKVARGVGLTLPGDTPKEDEVPSGVVVKP